MTGHDLKPLLLLLTVACIVACNPRKSDVSVVSSDELRALVGGTVEEIEVLAIAEDANTTVTTAETISDHFHVKLDVRRPALSGPEINSLVQALRSTSCRSKSDAVDVRTAIIFWGTDHKKLKAFYYGSQGHGGQIDDGAPCDLSPGLYKWAHRQLAPVLGP